MFPGRLEGMKLANMSDREITAELQRLCDILSSSVKDVVNIDNVQERLSALRQLSKFAHADLSKRQGFLLVMSMCVKVPLQRHIEELRTVLSKEACAVVAAFAEHSSNRSAWRAASEWFISSLLQLTMRTKRVFVNAAVETLEVLAKTNSFGSGAFAELIRGCCARHAATRSCTFGVLQLIIQRSQNDRDGVFSFKYVDVVCKALRSGLVDADAETRKRARLCYWAFYACEPEAAQTLYNGLENSARRGLDRKQNKCEAMAKSAEAVNATPLPAAKVNPQNKEGIKELSPLFSASKCAGKCQGNTTARKSGVETNPTVLTAAETWELAREALRSTLWSERLLGLQRVSEGFSHFCNKSECVKLLIPRLNDPNIRVSEAAIKALRLVMEHSPALLKNELPEVVAALFVNMCGSREALSKVSREHLSNIVQANSVDDVMLAIYRIFGDVTAPRVKVCAVEYAQYLYKKNAEHFQQISPMKLAVTELLRSLKSDKKDGDLRKAGVSALVTLYLTAKPTFLRALLQLTPNEQDDIFETLESAIPHLAQECRRRSLGKKLLQHFPLHAESPYAEGTGDNRDPLKRYETGLKRRNMLPNQAQTKPLATVETVIDQQEDRGVSVTRERTNSGGGRPHFEGGDVSAAPSSSRPGRLSSGKPIPRADRQIHWDPTISMADVLSGRVVHDNKSDSDISSVLERLDEVYGVVDISLILDRICNMITLNPKLFVNAFGRLIVQLEKLISQSCEPNHAVRRRAFIVLRAVVGQGVLWGSVSRYLKRVILLIRAGIDDAFLEVQVEATAALHIILNSDVYPIDHCLNALAMSLETWLGGEDEYSSRGWLTLLESVERLFSRFGRSLVLVHDYSNKKSTPEDSFSNVVNVPVLSRVCSAVVRAIQHGVSEVRLTAVMTCVSIWMAVGSVALPHFIALTASQRKLVSIYYNKTVSERMSDLNVDVTRHCDMGREMRAMGLPEAVSL